VGKDQLGLPWPEDEDPSLYPAAGGEPTVQQEIDRWLKAHEFGQIGQVSEDTFRSRRSQLKSFRAWCDPRGIVRVSDISSQIVQRYLSESRDGGYAVSSLRTRSHCLRAWFTWLVEEGLIRAVPRFSTPTPEEQLVEVLRPEQVDAILAACGDGSPIGYRDRALILFLYATGARASEASKLRIADLDLERLRAKVHGKGNRERMVYLTPPAAEAVRLYLDRYRVPCSIPKHDAYVFLSSVGRRLARGVVYYAVHKRGRQAGIDGVYPHLLRHTVATLLLENGAELRSVQEVLGHRKLQSTQRYTHLSTDAIRKTVERFHPHSKPGPSAADAP
jgi:integrase/recombinase XerD